MRPRFRIAALGVSAGITAIVIGVLASAMLFTATAQAAPDDTAIRQAALDAAVSEQQAPVLPLDASTGLAVPKSALAVPQADRVTNPAAAVPATVRQGMVTRGNSDLAKHFGGKELDSRKQTLQQLVDRQNDDVRILAAGVDNFTITSVVVSGDKANVAATGVAWRDIAQVQAGGHLAIAHPRSGMVYAMTLQNIGGVWLVIDQTMSYADGQNP